MSSPRLIYRPRADATPESEARFLAEVYRFVLLAHERKKGAHPGTPDDVKKEDVHTAKNILP